MAKGKSGGGRNKQRSREEQLAKREARQDERRREQTAKVERERARRRKRLLVNVGVVAGFVAVVVLAAGWFFFIRESPRDITADGPPLTDDEGAVVTGDGPVEVTVISDFGCPACAQFEAQAGPALDQYVENGDVTLRYRLVSALDRASPNEFSSRSIAVAGCVLEQDDPELWSAYKTGVFGSQPTEGEDGPSDTELIGIATQAGADEDAVTACVDNGDMTDWAGAVNDNAAGDYTGTPDVAVDGTRVTDATPANVTAAIDSAIAGG